MPLRLFVDVTCDNALSTYVDDDQGKLRQLRSARPMTTRPTISHQTFAEPNVWELAYFYVVAWSDLYDEQWMKAYLSADGLVVDTGDCNNATTVWRVMSVGNQSRRIELSPDKKSVVCGDVPPPADEVSGWLSTPRNWIIPSCSGTYGTLYRGRTAVWYDSCKQDGSTAPFKPGWDHGEPLVFRVPIIVLAGHVDVFFPFDKNAQLVNQASAMWQLKRLAEQLKLVGTTHVRKLVINGHTSNDGTAEYNMKLSQERAEYVKGVLKTNGVPQALEAKGYGFTQLKVSTDPKSASNRRVEIELVR